MVELERISDADRHRVVDRLREASAEGLLDLDEFSERVGEAYGARTRGELERLVADLPAPRPAPPPEHRGVRWTVAVCSGQRRGGPWRPDRRTRALAVLGSCVIDLSEVEREYLAELQVRAVALLGGVEVLVPSDARVEVGGFAILGGRQDRVRSSAGAGPVVRVRTNAILGGVTVRTRNRPVP